MMRVFALLVVMLALASSPLLLGCGGTTVTTDQSVTAGAGGMTLDTGTSTGGADGYVYVPTMGVSSRQASYIIQKAPPDAQHAGAGLQVQCTHLGGTGSRQVSTTTDGYGYFLFLDLAPGTYRISVGDGTVDVTVTLGAVVHPDGSQDALPAGFRALFVDLASEVSNWEQLREYLKDVNWIRVGFTSDNLDETALQFNLYMGDLPSGGIVAGPRTAALIHDLNLPNGLHTFALGDINITMTQTIKDLVFGGRFWLYGWVTPAPTSPVTISNIEVQLNLKIGQEIL